MYVRLFQLQKALLSKEKAELEELHLESVIDYITKKITHL